MSTDIKLDTRLLKLVKELVETRPDLEYERVEDFVELAVETWLKEHGQQARARSVMVKQCFNV